jgi:hypothetical protein
MSTNYETPLHVRVILYLVFKYFRQHHVFKHYQFISVE